MFLHRHFKIRGCVPVLGHNFASKWWCIDLSYSFLQHKGQQFTADSSALPSCSSETHRRRLKKSALVLNSSMWTRQEAASGPREVGKARTGRQSSFLWSISSAHPELPRQPSFISVWRWKWFDGKDLKGQCDNLLDVRIFEIQHRRKNKRCLKMYLVFDERWHDSPMEGGRIHK